MKYFGLLIAICQGLVTYSQNVGIGTANPEGKLHIKSSAIQTQLIVDAAPSQSNTPWLKLRSSNGTDQLHIRSTQENIFVGYNAGQNNAGHRNMGVGFKSLEANQGGSYNVGYGQETLSKNVTGEGNTAIGGFVLANSTGNFNTALGLFTMIENVTGNENTAIGSSALRQNYSGNFNTAVGNYALSANTVGAHYNVAIGYQALAYNNTGVRNIAIGAGAGTSNVSQYGNTISIGNHNYLNAAFNQAFIGNLNILWNGGNVPWSTFSDARIKTNITEDVIGLPFIMRLRPVVYNRDTRSAMALTGNKDDELLYAGKYDIEKVRFSGFLAQEVEQAAKEVGYNFQGVQVPKTSSQLYSLSYESFVVPLVKAVQEQQTQLELLTNENKILRERLDRLEKAIMRD